MSFPNVIYGSEEEVFNSYTVERVPVGAKMVIEDGRVFRFSECGAAALVVGSLNQAELPTTNTQDEAIGTLAAGVTVLTGVGSTVANQAINLHRYGYLWSSTVGANLPLMRIKSNTLITAAAATGTITLYVPTPVAIAAATTISYIKNMWRDVIIHDSPATGKVVGVCKVALAIDAFGWLQTTGPCSVLYDSTTTALAAIGDPACPDTQVDGAVCGFAAGTAETDSIVGYGLGLVEADGEQTLVWLTLG